MTDPEVTRALERLQRTAAEHDAEQTDRLHRWRIIEPDTGRLLWFLVQALQARTVVEIGTSRGASTLWLADAVHRTGGQVTSWDLDSAAQHDARQTLIEAGREDVVTLHQGDGGDALAALPPRSVDLLLLDSERDQYASWWPHPLRILRHGGVLAVDNVSSHAKELTDLQRLLESDPRPTGVSVHPVGKGLLLATRH